MRIIAFVEPNVRNLITDFTN